MNRKKILIRKEKLDNIIAAYAEMWADVLLDRNLHLHFSRINDDLQYLRQLIDSKDANHPDTLSYHKIADQLIHLKEIVAAKLRSGK
jgi:hypothetical protein